MGHVDASTTGIYTHYAPDLAGERSLADKAFSVAPAPGPAASSPLPGL